MDITSPHRPAPARPRRPKPSSARWLAASLFGAIAAVALGCLAVATRPPVLDLGYGAFKKALVEGKIRSARVGTVELTGELAGPGPGAIPARFRVSRLGLENDAELPGLLDRHLPGAYEAEPGPSRAQAVLVPLLMLGLACGLVYLLVQRSGGLGSAMAFARSRHREYGKADVRVTFSEVAGNDEAVAELKEVVEFLRTPEKYQALGGRIPKGVLLVGPPGTGKTLLARAAAGEAGVPFFSLSGSDFVEMFVGVGAARVRNLFSQAEAKAPCLVFIDELDALGKARGGGGGGGSQDERDQTLNQLLVAMDGFNANSGVIVMAATNRPETLDPALVRPGRFDRHINVDRPDIAGREQILQVHTRTVALEDRINLRQIAAMTTGFVGADLANLVNEAALLAARKGKGRVGRIEFEEGVERLIAGPEKKQRVLRPDERLRIAYHEAGHALVARSLPHTDPVHKVSILGRAAGTLGYTLYRPEDDRFLHTEPWLENTIRTLLGGTIAEELVYGDVSDGATSDLQRASQIARKMVAEFGMSASIGRVSYQNEGRSPFMQGGGANRDSWSEQTAREIDLEVRRILDDAERATRAILAHRRLALEDVARLLIERESIDAAELGAALDRHPFDLATLGLGLTPKPRSTVLPPSRFDRGPA